MKGESPPLRVSQQTAEMSLRWIPEYDLGMDVLWRIDRGLDCNCSRTCFKDELNQVYQRRDRKDNTVWIVCVWDYSEKVLLILSGCKKLS